jgi:hypothetical protein
MIVAAHPQRLLAAKVSVVNFSRLQGEYKRVTTKYNTKMNLSALSWVLLMSVAGAAVQKNVIPEGSSLDTDSIVEEESRFDINFRASEPSVQAAPVADFSSMDTASSVNPHSDSIILNESFGDDSNSNGSNNELASSHDKQSSRSTKSANLPGRNASGMYSKSVRDKQLSMKSNMVQQTVTKIDGPSN